MTKNKQPYVSFCILTYKQEDYILDALRGAVAQDYDDMEIIISDDCSPDSTFERIQEFVASYKGDKKIVVNRNDHNLGLVPHYNKVLGELANGEILVIADGDDVSYPNRTVDTVDAFKDENVMLVTGGHRVIDSKGAILETMCADKPSEQMLSLSCDYLKSKTFMCGDFAPAFRRKVLDWFGPLSNDCQTEDSTLRLRAILLGSVVSTNKIFQYYRRHDNNITSTSNIFRLKTKQIADQYKRDIEKAYQAGKISTQIYHKLKRKVNYYVCDREFARLRTQNRMWGIARRIVNLYYRITL